MVGYGYGYILGPSPVPPIYLTGSFGLVRPAWIKYTRSAVPVMVVMVMVMVLNSAYTGPLPRSL